MKCDEIFAALAMLEKERGIPQDFMMNKIVQALTTAYKRDHEGVENVVVEVNEEKRDLKMFVQKEIVEEVENPGSQISLEEARRISAKYELGGMVRFPVENVEFGRIAAGNGKQVIIQGLREAEHGMIYDEWGSKQHEILTGTVSRIDPRSGNVYLRIGTGNEATEGILSLNEQVSTETYTEGQLLKVYLVEVRRGTRARRSWCPGPIRALSSGCLSWRCRRSSTARWRSAPSPVRPAAAPRWRCGPPTRTWIPSAPASAPVVSVWLPLWRSSTARRSTSSSTPRIPPSSSPLRWPPPMWRRCVWRTRARCAGSSFPTIS